MSWHDIARTEVSQRRARTARTNRGTWSGDSAMSITNTTFGDYTLGPLLGRGGTSEVYAGTHRTTAAPVAIKLLRSHLASDPSAVAAFAAEAVRTDKIDHPNVVRILDAGGDSDGFYLVMERLDGETLAAKLSQAPFDEATARTLGAAIADGITAAHAGGVIHRDLKPGNVVVVAGRPVIVDFGIARDLSGPGTTSSRIGTPAYMAPEQLVRGVIAPCVDIWALGAILYEMVAGTVPFDTDGGRAPQLVDVAPRLTAVSPGYAQLVAACLAKEPSKRPSSAAEVARELRAPSTDRVTQDVAELPVAVLPMVDPAPPSRARRRRIAAVGTAAVIAVFGTLAIVIASRGPEVPVAARVEPAEPSRSASSSSSSSPLPSLSPSSSPSSSSSASIRAEPSSTRSEPSSTPPPAPVLTPTNAPMKSAKSPSRPRGTKGRMSPSPHEGGATSTSPPRAGEGLD